MRISDWSSDVCSSDLKKGVVRAETRRRRGVESDRQCAARTRRRGRIFHCVPAKAGIQSRLCDAFDSGLPLSREHWLVRNRSEEHTSELQSLMRISYAVFCLKKKTIHTSSTTHNTTRKQYTETQTAIT